MKKPIHDYTKADVAGISETGKVVIRKPNPKYNPHYSGMDEKPWDFEMLTFDELEEMKQAVEESLEERVAKLRAEGATQKTSDVYFLEHNQAHLARILNEAYNAVERKVAYHERYSETPLNGRKKKELYFLNMRDIAFEMMIDQMDMESMFANFVEPKDFQKVLALSAGYNRN